MDPREIPAWLFREYGQNPREISPTFQVAEFKFGRLWIRLEESGELTSLSIWSSEKTASDDEHYLSSLGTILAGQLETGSWAFDVGRKIRKSVWVELPRDRLEIDIGFEVVMVMSVLTKKALLTAGLPEMEISSFWEAELNRDTLQALDFDPKPSGP